MKNLTTILRLEWLRQTRSALWHKNLLVNLFLGLMVVYLLGNLLFVGLVLDDILLKIFPRTSPLEKLNSWLLYYFFFDFILRYFMQKLPAMTVEPYLHLPISKKSLAHLLLVRSKVHMFNFFHLLIFVPFAFEVGFKYYTTAEGLGWLVGVVSMVFALNFILMYIKRTAEISLPVYAGMIATLATLIGLEYFDLVSFSGISALAFNALFQVPLTALIPLGLAMGAYFLNFRYLNDHMYMGDLTSGESTKVSFVGAGFFSRFGLMGQLIDLDLKFIWRNKRTRSVLLLTILFLGYGLLIFPQKDFQSNDLMHMIFSIIITGMFTLNYGQYLLGWEAAHFDHILSRNVSPMQFFKSKFLLFALVSTACMVCSIPYAYFGWEILLALFCVYLFNVGITAPVVMFFGSLNPKKIDLSKGTVMNWQGVGAAQFLLVIPVLGLPMVIYGLGVMFWDTQHAMILIGIIGVAGILGSGLSIRLLGKWMEQRKYEISNDFRNN